MARKKSAKGKASAKKPGRTPRTLKDVAPAKRDTLLKKAAEKFFMRSDSTATESAKRKQGSRTAKNSAAAITQAELASVAIGLRRQGLSFRAIGVLMGKPKSTVHLWVESYRQAIVSQVLGSADSLIQEEIEQAEVMLLEIDRRLALHDPTPFDRKIINVDEKGIPILEPKRKHNREIDGPSNQEFVMLLSARGRIKDQIYRLLGLYTHGRERMRAASRLSDFNAAREAMTPTETRVQKVRALLERYEETYGKEQ